MKACISCNIEKDFKDFAFRKETNNYKNSCKSCVSSKYKEYYSKNKDKISNKNKEYHKENIEQIKERKAKSYDKLKKKEYNSLYFQNNKDKIKYNNKKYYQNNKQKVLKTNEINRKERLLKDPKFKIKTKISCLLRRKLKAKNIIKENSCFQSLNYSVEDLKLHIESQFEPWMAWDNWGRYDASWEDNDKTTWKWNIDHIIPESSFNYTSVHDEDFIKCWSLNNLRPYSAKLNVIDGVTRVRHL